MVLGLFNAVDDILPNILHNIFPTWIVKDADGSLKKIPGLGFIVVIFMVIVTGWISSLFVVGKLVEVLDKVLESTPGIKFIYSSVKDFLEAFAGNKKKFDKPVLVNVDGDNVWRIGFITQDDMVEFGLKDYVAVYIPMSYSISGNVYIIPRSRVKTITNISAAQSMKFAVSGGVTDVVEPSS